MICKFPEATTEALKRYPTCAGQDVAQGRAYEIPAGQGEGTCCKTEVIYSDIPNHVGNGIGDYCPRTTAKSKDEFSSIS